MKKDEHPELELVKQVKEAYVTARMLGRIPQTKRNAVDDRQHKEAVLFIKANLTAFAEIFFRLPYERVMVSRFVELENYSNGLEHASTRVPEMNEYNMDVSTMQSLIRKCYKASATVQGYLEELEPLQSELHAIIDKIRSVVKGLSLAESEWEAESIYLIVLPDELHKKVYMLDALVLECQRRRTALQNAYEMISRYITTMQGDPAEIDRPVAATYDGGRKKLNQVEAPKRAKETKPTPKKSGSWKDRFREDD